MEKIEHTTVATNGINMHVASLGTGPVVLFLHGFPQLWYAWRHHLLYLSSRGYRALAPDLRGYGDTDAPPLVTSYTIMHVVGDLIGLLDKLGIEQIFLVGHDWGAIIAWYFCLLRPDRVKALVTMSVQFLPRDPARTLVDGYRASLGDDFYICRFQVFLVGHDWGATIAWYFCLLRPDRVKASVNLSVLFIPRNPARKPVDGHRVCLGDDFYICMFQEPGVAEEDFAQIATASLIKKILAIRNPQPPCIPKEIGFRGLPDPPTLPSWLSEEDVNYYATKFDLKGFIGPLNYYRCMDPNWELLAPWTGVPIKVPVKFIIGDLDLTYHIPGAKEYIHNGGFKKDVPNLQDLVVMEGAAHFVHEEKAEEVSAHVYDFIKKF